MESGGLATGVVIPAFNPCSRLHDVLAGIPAMVSVVVVVDDGSSQPLDVADLHAAVPVEVVRHDRNMGVGAAIMSGYRKCRLLGIDVAVVMGADDQMDPADLPALVAPVLDGRADYSKGDRLSHPDCPSAMPVSRRFGNVCLTFLTRLATGLPVMDAQCGYTALRLDRLDELASDRIYPRYGFPNDMLAAVSGAGLAVADVTVRPVYEGGASGIVAPIAAVVYPLIIARSLMTRFLAEFVCHRAMSVRGPGDGGA